MARRPLIPTNLRNRLSTIDTSEVTALSRLSTLDTTDEDFGEVFRENPAAALAAKGINISAAEAANIKQQLTAIGRPGLGGGGNPLATEVKVEVGVKF